MRNIVLVFFFITTAYSTVQAELQCYQCEWADDDPSCLDTVEDATVVTCPNYCGVAREDDLIKEELNWFRRTCYDFENNDVIESDGKRVSSETCSSNLCNTGDGTGGASPSTGILSATLISAAVLLKQVIL